MSIEIRLDKVTKSFRGKKALSEVDCVFPAGGVSAVIGPNGSGKTTLMRLVARLDRPDSGCVGYYSGGRSIPPGPGLMRDITFASHSPVLFSMSLKNNIAYGLRARGLPRDEVRMRVEEALEAGGLSQMADARPETLSGGEAQRAAMARVYALRPDAALLDEPTANIDPEGVAAIEGMIKRMNGQFGTTVLIVTHNIFQARRIADSVYLLYGGELVESGGREEFFGSPSTALARRFISGEVVY